MEAGHLREKTFEVGIFETSRSVCPILFLGGGGSLFGVSGYTAVSSTGPSCHCWMLPVRSFSSACTSTIQFLFTSLASGERQVLGRFSPGIDRDKLNLYVLVRFWVICLLVFTCARDLGP